MLLASLVVMAMAGAQEETGVETGGDAASGAGEAETAGEASGDRVPEPLRGFVSVEPYRVRVEALVRPAAFAGLWRFEESAVDAAGRELMLENVVTLLSSGVIIRNGGRALAFSESSARFIVPHPERGYITDDRPEIPLEDALIGVHVTSDESEVEALDIEWLWFAPGQERLVVEIASAARPAARYVTRESRSIRWKAEEVSLSVPAVIPPVEFSERRYLMILFGAGTVLLLVAGLAVVIRQYETPPWNAWIAATGVVLIAASFLSESHYVSEPDEERAYEIAYGLLRNTYRAFDFRDESTIYDTLAESVSGILLESVYLEVLESLEIGEEGGPRVRVYEIDLRDCEPLPEKEEAEGFRARCEWATIGEVTHWGHTHERTNVYEAEIRFDPVNNSWRITGLDLRDEKRIQRVSRRDVALEGEGTGGTGEGENEVGEATGEEGNEDGGEE